MSNEIYTSPSALKALANEIAEKSVTWPGSPAKPEHKAILVLRAVAAEKEARADYRSAVKTMASVLRGSERTFTLDEVGQKIAAATNAPEDTERDRLKALNTELLAALKGWIEPWDGVPMVDGGKVTLGRILIAKAGG